MLKSANRQILIVIGRIERMAREDGRRRRGGIVIGPGRRWEMGEDIEVDTRREAGVAD